VAIGRLPKHVYNRVNAHPSIVVAREYSAVNSQRQTNAILGSTNDNCRFMAIISLDFKIRSEFTLSCVCVRHECAQVDDGELGGWIDHATDVLDKAAASTPSTAAIREHLTAVKTRILGGVDAHGDPEDSECVRTYGGSSEAVALREAARTPLGSFSEVGTVIRHRRYGYRGVVIG
jgi:hypothetical protein